MSTVLFAPRQPEVILEILRSLTPAGFDVAVADPGTPEFYQAAADAEYFLGFARNMGSEFFRSAPKMRLVQLTSAGYDQVDVEAARKAGVPVSNNGGANAIAVAEHTMMLMLATLKRLVWHHNNVVAGTWRIGNLADARVYEVAGKTLGVIGLGNIGKKVARRAAGFDMKVIYYDIRRLTEDAEDALGARFVLLAELMRRADVVSLHVPLDDSTRGLIGAKEIALMKPSAIIVNTCRGPVIDENALYQALKSEQIMGAGLDVMVDEPPKPNHPMLALPNVTLTPHSAGPTWDNWWSRFRNGFDNIERVASGRAPLWVIPELASQ
ncbi:MAG: lactate dehydrogenase [Candidatus Rokubacteria bacterium]|nr:lactate dehydrogenase [Candidatus Rokubacteria bacterium]